MANQANQVENARQTYAAVLRALDAAARWQNQEVAQAESECARAIQTAETARKQAEESAARMRADGLKQANDRRQRAEDAVKQGETLYQNANLGKSRPQVQVPLPLLPSGIAASQALQHAADLATRTHHNLQTQLAELGQARSENSLEKKRIFIAGAIFVAIALVIIAVLAFRA